MSHEIHGHELPLKLQKVDKSEYSLLSLSAYSDLSIAVTLSQEVFNLIEMKVEDIYIIFKCQLSLLLLS